MKKREYTIELSGKKITAQFSDLADQANGSVILSCENTSVLATAVMSKNDKESDYFPLTVEYEEKFYAAGQILGSQYLRREGRPSDEAILSGRVVDRTLRPLFDQYIRKEIQVIITVLSLGDFDPDTLAVNAASLAVSVSDIPFHGPVSAVKIMKISDNGLISNPKVSEILDENKNEMELLACGKDGNINMIEVGSQEQSEEILMQALTLASSEIEKIQEWQEKIISEIGKEKIKIEKPQISEEIINIFQENISPKLEEFIFSGSGKKGIESIENIWKETLKEKEVSGKDFSLALEHLQEKIDEIIHTKAIKENKRPDGRGFDEIRNLYAQAGGVSPMLHGTGIFYRGETHVMSILTLGGPQDALVIDGMEEKMNKRFMHHYNFPPFSVGETGRVGGINRRMIGHGALAEKALRPVIPNKKDFPYTIRIVSESMASNGSTSMASVCGSTLALMDAGVPIKKAVAGIASGLMMKSADEYKILTDIQGPEDHHGDMDFKVAGTIDGITAVQMDVKVSGIPLKVLEEAFKKAKIARENILEVINKEISSPRESLNPNAPEIKITKILVDKIGMVIGSGGKTIKEIKEKTGAEISIEDDGSVFATGKNGSAQKAIDIIEGMTRVFKEGDKETAEVIKIVDFGAFVKIGYNTEGLVHISEIAPFRIDSVSNYLKVGQKIPIVVKAIEDNGKLKLSIKEADPNLFKEKNDR